MRSRAIIFSGSAEPMRVEEVELGKPAPGDVLVALTATGSCHSDLHYLRGYREVGARTHVGGRGGACSRRSATSAPPARR